MLLNSRQSRIKIWDQTPNSASFLLQIKTTVMDVEFPLIKSELEAIDVKLLSAETTLFWNGEST